MPLHLELGSDGRSFHGKAIVVNSITGKHYSEAPIPLKKAEAQKRVIEGAMEKHGEHVTASGKPAKRIHAPLRVSEEVAEGRRLRHEAKKLKPAEAKVAMLEEKLSEQEQEPIAPLKAKKVKALRHLERSLMDSIAGASTVKHKDGIVSTPSDMVKKIVNRHYDSSINGRDYQKKEHQEFRKTISALEKYLAKVSDADHMAIYDILAKH
jgi:hypothetical protein